MKSSSKRFIKSFLILIAIIAAVCATIVLYLFISVCHDASHSPKHSLFETDSNLGHISIFEDYGSTTVGSSIKISINGKQVYWKYCREIPFTDTLAINSDLIIFTVDNIGSPSITDFRIENKE